MFGSSMIKMRGFCCSVVLLCCSPAELLVLGGASRIDSELRGQVRYIFIQNRKKLPETLSSKTLSSTNTFVPNYFIQNRRQFHPMTLSSKNGFVQ